ncbi:Protein TAR1 [Rhynchospora pubera]|uniref:Protein TAR1 n=1 Tax=Rhynchospora pubera TaxID=906938 RepID=A0AAV8AK31_9POAL|nr:Protein TAR1 [Rhynchospora pubera]
MLQLEPFTEDRGRPAVITRSSASLRLPGLRTRRLARMSDSLVRVSRRVGWGARRPTRPQRSAARTRRARAGAASDRDASPAPIRFPPGNFKHSLTLFSKSFSSFPRGTCSLSVSRQYLALDGVYRPLWAAFPNNPTRRQRLVVRQGPSRTGLSPSPAPPSRGLGLGPSLRSLLQTTIRTAEPPRF